MNEDYYMLREADLEFHYSPLDSVSELYYVKKKLEELGRKDAALCKQLEQGLSEEELKEFRSAMAAADELQKEVEKAN